MLITDVYTGSSDQVAYPHKKWTQNCLFRRKGKIQVAVFQGQFPDPMIREKGHSIV